MTAKDIEQKFYEALDQRGVSSKLEGISRDVIYNWRNKRGRKPTIGEMLGVLYQLDLIFVFPQSKADKEAWASWKKQVVPRKEQEATFAGFVHKMFFENGELVKQEFLKKDESTTKQK